MDYGRVHMSTSEMRRLFIGNRKYLVLQNDGAVFENYSCKLLNSDTHNSGPLWSLAKDYFF